MKEKIRRTTVNILTATIGNFLVLLFPKKVEKLENEGITLVVTKNVTLVEQLMRKAILRKFQKEQKFDSLSDIHRNYWKNQGKDFFNVTKKNLETIHLPRYEEKFQVLQEQLELLPEKFTTLVEIGVGNGTVLSFLEKRFPNFDKLIGIDLSKEQIKINQSMFKDNPKMEFVAADVLDWIKQNGHANMVFFTFRGVMEYFSQAQMEKFFSQLNNLGPIIFFGIEPNGTDHDFSINPNSQIYGLETSFSHNYPLLYENSGFKIWYLDAVNEDDSHYVMTVFGAKNF